MIQIRPYTPLDEKKCEPIEKESGIQIQALLNSGYHFFVVEDQNQITGVCDYRILNAEQASIEHIYVRKEDRGFKLGDGLLRAVLNQLNRLHIKRVFVSSTDAVHGFYLKEGLEVHYQEPGNEKLIFVALLPDFFNRPCKSHQ